LLLLGLAGCTLIQPHPSAEFDISPVILYAGEIFELDGSLSRGSASIVNYTWQLGDGQSLLGQQVNAMLSFAGSYTITLTIEDANGNSDSVARQVVVYARTGTVIIEEDFSDAAAALARWVLDPTWASANDAQIDFIQGATGNALYIHSAASRWHRRYHAVELPPLRVGQKAVFSCRIMALRNQDFHTYLFAPGRAQLDSLVGALPYFLFTNESDGAYVHIPSSLGTDVGYPIAFEPEVYRWYSYRFEFDSDSFKFLIDDVLWMEGTLNVSFKDKSIWSIVIGEESLTETCNAYFDDIRVTIEE
jgi:hypothetical protein